MVSRWGEVKVPCNLYIPSCNTKVSIATCSDEPIAEVTVDAASFGYTVSCDVVSCSARNTSSQKDNSEKDNFEKDNSKKDTS